MGRVELLQRIEAGALDVLGNTADVFGAVQQWHYCSTEFHRNSGILQEVDRIADVKKLPGA